jgi:4-amino-4-deoxy-L-arabinose transferase-like glycosyltransferase
VVVVDAHQARADQVLLLWTTLTQFALWQVWQRRHATAVATRPWTVLFWIALTLGVMTKGPITPAIAALTVLALSYATRSWSWIRRLHPLLGPLVPLGFGLAWLAAVAYTVGFDKIALTVARETLGRSVTSIDGHGRFPGFYTLLAPITLWPASLALVPALWLAGTRAVALPAAGRTTGFISKLRDLWSRWQQRQLGRSAECFLIAWILPSWLLFECLATRLVHYTLPLYPAIALLCARAVLSRRAWRWLLSTHLGVAALRAWIVLSVVLLCGLPLVLAWLGAWQPPDAGTTGLATALFVALGISVVALVYFAVRQRFLALQLAAIGGAVIVHVTLFQLLLPNLQHVWLSARIVQHLREQDVGRSRPIAAVGYHEDSLMFLSAGAVERVPDEELEGWLATHPDGLALTPVPPADAADPLVSGFNYSNGKWQSLWLVDARLLLTGLREDELTPALETAPGP